MSEQGAGSDPTETLAIQNVVASTGIEHELDLHAVAMDLDGPEYDPEQFPGLIYRPSIHSTVLLFRSGKIICTGAQSVEEVHEALQMTVETLRALGIQVTEMPEITVQNIVANGDLGEELNLQAIAIGLGLETVEYEPEQFPGLIYRLDKPDVVVLLFGSGKLVITGGKTTEEVDAAVETVTSQLMALGHLG